MLTILSKKFVNLLIHYAEKTFDKDDIEVYTYGVECFLNTFIVTSILCIWGILTHSLLDMLLWIFSFSLIRHYAGGLHASSELSCILSSILIGVTNYYSIQYIHLTIWSFLYCLLICLFLAPINTCKFELTQKHKRMLKAKACFIILINATFCFIIGENTLTLSSMYALVCACSLCTIAYFKKNFLF